MAQASVIIEGDTPHCFAAVVRTFRAGGKLKMQLALPQVARFWRGGPQAQGPRQRNILSIISLFIVATKTCPISAAMSKFRDIASRASNSIAGEESGI
jgi:hypothetical protein